MNNTPVSDQSLDGIDPIFHGVCTTHSREMFELLYSVGVANQAITNIVTIMGKHSSRGGLAAATIISQAFNQVTQAYIAQKGWTQEQLAQCDRDIQLAFQLSNGGQPKILVMQ